MKKEYKLLLILLICSLFAIIINFTNIKDKISIISVGDGISKGITSLGMEGVSYNDYLKDYYLKKRMLDNYNTEFSRDNLTTEELYNLLLKNKNGSKSNLPFKQLLAKANLIIVNIGMDELNDYIIRGTFNKENVNKYLDYYNRFCYELRSFYDKDVIVLGLYPSDKLNKNIVYALNKNIKKICMKHNLKFIDLMALSLNEKYFAENGDYHLNNLGHKEIFKQIIKKLDCFN